MASLHPAAKSVYFCVGLFGAAWMNVLLDQDLYVFTTWGLASGALLVSTVALNVTVVIPAFGVAKSTSIVSGLAVVTSVMWNYVLKAEVRSQVGTWIGVTIVLVAMNGLIFGKEEVTERSVAVSTAGLTRVSSKHQDVSSMETTEAPLVVTASEASTDGYASSTSKEDREGNSTGLKGRAGAGYSSVHLGIMTLVCGVMAGSILIPMDYADEEFHGIVYIPSMAIGSLLIVLPVSYGQFSMEGITSYSDVMKEMRFTDGSTSAQGSLCGAIFGVACACNIKAIDDLDYATAMVLMQTQILVSGTWGIVLYNELRGKEIVFFFMWGSMLVGGALITGYYGTTH